MSRLRGLFIFSCVLLAGFARADEAPQVEATLDRFHHSAAIADSAAYFAVMTDDVVFLGTDSSERWQGQEFRDFVTSHFSEGRGWTYQPAQRDIVISADGKTAWFDELLNNDGLGTCRGSGILLKSAAGWKIAQYNLSVPIPNAMVRQVATDIAALQSGASQPDSAEPKTEAQAQPPAKKENCVRKRFKTNTAAGCQSGSD